MIRVLHVVGIMNRGGIETFIMNVYRKIDRKKLQFDFLVHTNEEGDYNKEIESLGGKIFPVIPRKQGLIKNRRSLDEFFKAHTEYSIIHQHISSLSYIEPIKFAKKHRVPTRIVHGHSTREGGSFIHKYIHRWNQIGLKSIATDYFACSDYAAKWFYGKRHYYSGEFTIINNGIETERFVYNSNYRYIVRKELGLVDKFVIGNVGRFVKSKNHNFLIDIFKYAHDKNSNAVLCLVGDGEERSQIEKKINELGLTDSVILTGTRSDIPNLLQAMDVFVMPSYYEGLPVTLVEAQAASLSCIVSDNITKNVKITELIEYISLDKGPEYWAEKVNLICGINNRINTQSKIIESKFDVKEVAEDLQNYYSRKSKDYILWRS